MCASAAGLLFFTYHHHHLWLSSPQPGNYVRTVHRTEQSYQACNDIVACFMERAKVEKQYAQQLSQWSSKWKSIVESRKYRKLRDGESWGCRDGHLYPDLSDHLSYLQVKITPWLLLNWFICACVQWTIGGHYLSIRSMTHLCALWYLVPPSVFLLSFPRASVRLPHGSLAVLLYLHRALVDPPLLHLPVACRRGRHPGEDLAEGDLSQKDLLRVQRELRQQVEFFACAETLDEKDG